MQATGLQSSCSSQLHSIVFLVYNLKDHKQLSVAGREFVWREVVKDGSEKSGWSKAVGGPEHLTMGFGLHSVHWRAILGCQEVM